MAQKPFKNLTDRFKVEIPERKITDYLLNIGHSDGRAKAEFFIRNGISPKRPQVLDGLLRDILKDPASVSLAESAFGTKFVVDGAIRFPNGRTYPIRTVWINEKGTDGLKLVTAYRT